MEEVLDRDETLDTEIEQLTDREVFTEIWTQPRRVFRFIHATDYQKYWYLLVALAGIVRSLDSFTNTQPSLGKLLVRVAIGAALGWLGIYITAAIIGWIAGIFKGKGTTSDMYRCVVYAYLPLSVLVPVLILVEAATITGFFDFASTSTLILAWVIQGIVMIATAYFIVLLIVATEVVQGIKTWQAAVTVIVPVALMTAGAFALVFNAF